MRIIFMYMQYENSHIIMHAMQNILQNKYRNYL